MITIMVENFVLQRRTRERKRELKRKEKERPTPNPQSQTDHYPPCSSPSSCPEPPIWEERCISAFPSLIYHTLHIILTPRKPFPPTQTLPNQPPTLPSLPSHLHFLLKQRYHSSTHPPFPSFHLVLSNPPPLFLLLLISPNPIPYGMATL